jgi:tetratricopeptide (TPR) repeat protein
MSRFDAGQLWAAALSLYNERRLPEAESALRMILGVDARNADAPHLLGIISLVRGNPHAAFPMLQRAVTLRPNYAAAWNTMGECHRAMGRPDLAITCYRRAIATEPTFAAAHSNLGAALCDGGRPTLAAEAFRAAIELQPGLVNAHCGLARALGEEGDLPGAAAVLRAAIERIPPSAELAPAFNNLGAALERMDQLPEAMEAYRRAFELDGSLAVSANNVVNVARQLNRWPEAVDWTARALGANADFLPARWNRALLDLTFGDYAAGLPAYELRFTGTDQRHPPFLTGPVCRPDDDLTDRTLLLYAEQGFGDAFQAARYLPAIIERAGRVVVLCFAEQARLFRGVPGLADVVVGHDRAVPPYDRFAAMMSLPYLCGTTSLAQVPTAVPYLAPPADANERWRSRLANGTGMKVGLVWAGSARPDPLRTCPLSQLSPLLDVPGVRWFSLQVGPAAAELAAVGGERIVDLSSELIDFAETAAAMNALDLIVSIDTATCHLAGALGRPTWTLLPFSPDWRWLLDRPDSPWYPTMRLFRQAERRAWGPVVERVAGELRALVAG